MMLIGMASRDFFILFWQHIGLCNPRSPGKLGTLRKQVCILIVKIWNIFFHPESWKLEVINNLVNYIISWTMPYNQNQRYLIVRQLTLSVQPEARQTPPTRNKMGLVDQMSSMLSVWLIPAQILPKVPELMESECLQKPSSWKKWHVILVSIQLSFFLHQELCYTRKCFTKSYCVWIHLK